MVLHHLLASALGYMVTSKSAFRLMRIDPANPQIAVNDIKEDLKELTKQMANLHASVVSFASEGRPGTFKEMAVSIPLHDHKYPTRALMNKFLDYVLRWL
jgi:hypothetical protein